MPINKPFELLLLREEFADTVGFTNDGQGTICDNAINTLAADLQHSTDEYTLVIPKALDSLAVEGGEWVPAVVFIPYPESE